MLWVFTSNLVMIKSMSVYYRGEAHRKSFVKSMISEIYSLKMSLIINIWMLCFYITFYFEKNSNACDAMMQYTFNVSSAPGLNQSVVVVWSVRMIITSPWSHVWGPVRPTLRYTGAWRGCRDVLRWSKVETVYDGHKIDWE